MFESIYVSSFFWPFTLACFWAFISAVFS
jgi:hypothetical protein